MRKKTIISHGCTLINTDFFTVFLLLTALYSLLNMFYKIAADIIVVIHFIWIIFMFLGFFFTIYGFFWKKFFDWWLFRTLHLSGILFVGMLTILRRFCPLTILENLSRARYSPEATYPGSFIVHYIENLVYPDVNQTLLRTGTVILAVFILVVYIIRPPAKIKKLLINQ